jgi:hypothetical protein
VNCVEEEEGGDLRDLYTPAGEADQNVQYESNDSKCDY